MRCRRYLRRLLLVLLLMITCGFAIAMTLTAIVVAQFNGSAEPALLEISGGQGSSGEYVCGIVFGAAVHQGDLPGPGIHRRVATAARLYQEGILEHIILTGGKGGEEVASEAEVMRGVALSRGIAAGDLSLEEQARSTWENLLFSRSLARDCTTVIGISDRYHLARIAYMARVQGWENFFTLPSDREATWPFEVKSTGREVVALFYYMLLTHLLPMNAIAHYGVSAVPRVLVPGLMITKSDHLVCQLIN